MNMVPFIGGGVGLTRAISNGIETTRNFYLEAEKGKNPTKLVNRPGGELVVDFYNAPYNVSGVLRGLYTSSWGSTYVVISDALYSLDIQGKTAMLLGKLASGSGRIYMVDNGWHLAIADGQLMWTMNADDTGLEEVANDLFSKPCRLATQGGRILVQNNDETNGEPGSDPAAQPITRNNNRVYYSGYGPDGARTWTLEGGAGWIVAESGADPILNISVVNGELILIGSRSVEFWRPTGDAVAPYAFASGTGSRMGTTQPDSVVLCRDSLMWWGADGSVYMMDGYAPKQISTPDIEYSFRHQDNPVGVVTAGSFDMEGHSFALWTSEDAKSTWVYDLTTGYWAIWDSIDGYTQTKIAYDYRYFTSSNGYVIAAGSLGRIASISLDKYTEYDGRAFTCQRIGQVFWDAMMPITIREARLDMEPGVGLSANDPNTGTGLDPKAALRVSFDGGHTFGAVRETSIGTQGYYKKEAFWRALGRGRSCVLDVSISDPVKRVLLGMRLVMDKGVK